MTGVATLGGSFEAMSDGRPRREAMLSRIEPRSSDTTPWLTADRALAAVDDVDERLVGGAVGLRPQLLDPRPAERELGALDGGVAQRAGGGSGQSPGAGSAGPA